MSECPCKECNKRHATCHGSCVDYKNWRLELDEANKKAREAKLHEDDSYLQRLHWRNVRRRC